MTTPSPLGFLLHIQSPLCRGFLLWHFFLGCVEKVGVLAGKKLLFPPWCVEKWFLCLWHTPSLFEASPALTGNSFTSIVYIHYLFSIWRNWCCKLFRELDNDHKGNLWKLWEENWGLCSVSQLDSVFSLFMGNKELENHCCTVQILNFYCPKLESISSVLNCLLLALVQV